MVFQCIFPWAWETSFPRLPWISKNGFRVLFNAVSISAFSSGKSQQNAMVELSFVCPRIWEMLSISTPISASIYADIILKFCCIRIGFQDQPVFFFTFGKLLENEIYNSSLTFFRPSPYSFLVAFMAAPKALKSYNGTGRFAIFLHPITF